MLVWSSRAAGMQPINRQQLTMDENFHDSSIKAFYDGAKRGPRTAKLTK